MEEIPLILTLLDKAIRQVSLYGPDHPQANGSLEDVKRKLDAYLVQGNRLALEVYRGKFIKDHVVILELERQEKNYIQEMYIDGVRKIEFLPDVSIEELRNFAAVLARDITKYLEKEDDTVTLFWKQNFSHIRYETVDVYEGDMNALLRQTLIMDELEGSEKHEKNYLQQFVRKLLGEDSNPQAGIFHPNQSGLNKALQPISMSHFMDSTIRESLAAEVGFFFKRPFLKEVCIVFAEILEQEHDVQSFYQLCVRFRECAENFFSSGDVSMTYFWLKEFRNVQQFVRIENPAYFDLIEQEFVKFSDPQKFQVLGELFLNRIPGSPEDWLQLFECLGPTCTEGVCQLLLYVRQESMRSILVEFLQTCPIHQKDIFLKYLNQTDEGMLVRDMVRVLSVVLSANELPDAIRQLIFHDQEIVRFEVVCVTHKLSKLSSRPILQKALRDSSPKIRDEAFRLIAKSQDDFYARSLAEEFLKENFISYDAEEKKRAAIALARCGQSSTLSFFDQIVESSESDCDIRKAALFGISEVGDHRANELLNKYESRMFFDRSLKELARQLLQKHGEIKD